MSHYWNKLHTLFCDASFASLVCFVFLGVVQGLWVLFCLWGITVQIQSDITKSDLKSPYSSHFANINATLSLSHVFPFFTISFLTFLLYIMLNIVMYHSWCTIHFCEQTSQSSERKSGTSLLNYTVCTGLIYCMPCLEPQLKMKYWSQIRQVPHAVQFSTQKVHLF